jgi:hypothetical protein
MTEEEDARLMAALTGQRAHVLKPIYSKPG